LRLLLSMQYATPGKKLQFMGTELGQWNEWNHDAEVDWVLRTFDRHEGIRRMLCDLNRIYLSEPALHECDVLPEGFQWIIGDDRSNCVVAFLRKSRDNAETLVVVCNLTPVPRGDYQVGVPAAGFYREIFNSDAQWYDGTGSGNKGGVYSKEKESHGMENSIRILAPPLGVCIFKAITGPPPDETSASGRPRI
ncbi:MAG: alpha amylase C-terminal domain-containing protein, partial [Planctomycetaceae bacterium]|nr:alpha amylase C-terminal domain-containing protein [Planctomycetaceae bacterium]